LEDLILLAGGLRPDAYKVEAVIARMGRGTEEEDQRKVATIVVPVPSDFTRIPDEEKTPLETYDKIIIRNLPEWEPLPVVSVEGQIKYPGSYSLEVREERISSIIRRAGGLKKEAFPEGAVLFRRKDIIEMSQERQAESNRVAINLKKALENPGGPYDIVLKDDDRLFVPYNPGSVEVKGAVRNPSIIQYREGKGLDYYIKLCGGYRRDADKVNTIVCLPGNTASKKKKFLFFSSSPSILPGSIIEVPFKGEKREIEIVEVRGAVKNPTLVQYRRGEKLDYYIDLCGGYRENADIGNTIIHLPDGRILESRGVLSFNPYLLPGGVIEVPFKGEERELEVGDVDVRGAVRNPSLIIYRDDERLDYYIDFCGGYSQNADIENIVIHLPDGSTIERKGALSFNPDIPAGSIIEIPFKGKKEISK